MPADDVSTHEESHNSTVSGTDKPNLRVVHRLDDQPTLPLSYEDEAKAA